jgi:hypothetical protein
MITNEQYEEAQITIAHGWQTLMQPSIINPGKKVGQKWLDIIDKYKVQNGEVS